MMWVPMLRLAVLNVVVPLALSGRSASVVDPSVSITVPGGTPPLLCAPTVNVTELPNPAGLRLEVRERDVEAGSTVTPTADDADDESVDEPP
jgi:hypothetical protein